MNKDEEILRLKAENAELKETLQGNICAYCLKHEVEDCPHNPNKRALETGPAGEGRAFLKETTTIEKLQAERDALTCALAEARRTVEDDFLKHDCGYEIAPDEGACDVCEKYGYLRAILMNSTSLRASEEMKGLRRIAEASKKVMAWWDLNPEGTPIVEFKEALEAYERGKV